MQAAAGAVAAGVLKTDDAEAAHGTTINAISNTSAPAIHAENTSGEFDSVAVEVSALQGTAVRVSNEVGSGLAITSQGTGIFVRSLDFPAVVAQGQSIGVSATARDPFGVGLRASGIWGVEASGIIALTVNGRAEFHTVGSGTIPSGQGSAFVPIPPGREGHPFVTQTSHVTVTLTGDPGQASSAPGVKAVVVWFERQPGIGFTVHMSRKVGKETPFTYFIVDPIIGFG